MFCKLQRKKAAYVPKYNSNCEKQAILLMVPNGVGWYYPVVKKKLSALLRGIMSKNHGNSYCLNCLQSSARENKRKGLL